MRARTCETLFCLALLGFPAPSLASDQCSADCTHPTKACVCAIDPASPVAMTAIGGVERQRLVVRQALEIGDELMSANENAVVGLTCPGGSDVKLHGRFRTVIMPGAPGQDCVLNLLAGSADVLTDQRTELTSGETLMGSQRTLYSMRVTRDREAPQVECLVFEGEAEVQYRQAVAKLSLGASGKASIRAGQVARDVVSPRDVQAASVVYSRADLARARALGARIENPDAFKEALRSGYAAVLANPTDPAPRIALAELQTSARISRQALYHLDKAERLEPSRIDQKAAIAATKMTLYKRIGREQDAAVEAEKLRKLDPEKYKKIQRDEPLNIDRSTRQVNQPPVSESIVSRDRPAAASRGAALRGMVITATAEPAVVRRDQSTTLVVKVAASGGQPIAGATVMLTAGGGLFPRTGQPRDEGVTDASGFFRAQWLCKECAPAYQISVGVTATDFPAGKATIAVKTR
jgi:hypothetical protein